MIVTDILDYDKRKVLIQLDGYLIFPLYKSEVKRYHLMQGAELSEGVYTELMEELLPKRVKLRAMNLLQKRSYTTEGLKRKLLESRYPDKLVTLALDYVTSYGYLDDVRYAEEYIRCYCDSRSKRRIMQDLFAKGISGEAAEKAWASYEAENKPVNEETQIMDILRKKQLDVNSADRKEIARIMNYLYRKGYSADGIRRCIRANSCDTYDIYDSE